MYELIKIENTTIGDACVPTVSARELHEFLESKQQFSDWIMKRKEPLVRKVFLLEKSTMSL